MTPCQRVGIMYSLWHWPAARATQLIADGGGTPLTMEGVLRSRLETPTGAVPDAKQFSDILVTPGMEGRAMGFYWHHTPEVRALCFAAAAFAGCHEDTTHVSERTCGTTPHGTAYQHVEPDVPAAQMQLMHLAKLKLTRSSCVECRPASIASTSGARPAR